MPAGMHPGMPPGMQQGLFLGTWNCLRSRRIHFRVPPTPPSVPLVGIFSRFRWIVERLVQFTILIHEMSCASNNTIGSYYRTTYTHQFSDCFILLYIIWYSIRLQFCISILSCTTVAIYFHFCAAWSGCASQAWTMHQQCHLDLPLLADFCRTNPQKKRKMSWRFWRWQD